MKLPKLAVRVAGALFVHGQEVCPLHQEDVDDSTPSCSTQPFGRHLQTPTVVSCNVVCSVSYTPLYYIVINIIIIQRYIANSDCIYILLDFPKFEGK